MSMREMILNTGIYQSGQSFTVSEIRAHCTRAGDAAEVRAELRRMETDGLAVYSPGGDGPQNWRKPTLNQFLTRQPWREVSNAEIGIPDVTGPLEWAL